jgi:putative mRNA 3-end processing factor
MPVAAQVESYNYSVTADRSGLLNFLDVYRDTSVLVKHGDRCADFAEESDDTEYRPSAPGIGKTVSA